MKHVNGLFKACEATWIGLLSLPLQIGKGVEDFSIKMLLKEDNLRGNTPFQLNRFEGPSHTNMMHKAMFGGLYVFF
jgi:hypothetical protein